MHLSPCQDSISHILLEPVKSFELELVIKRILCTLFIPIRTKHNHPLKEINPVIYNYSLNRGVEVSISNERSNLNY